ncbi:MAG: DUF4124 domain-containing protein [Pseudomonadales bacterium]
MKKGNFTVLLLFLICTVTVAGIYKWTDESGRVHYGDEPPEEADAKSVTIPEGPSQEDIERAKQEAQEIKEQYGKSSEKGGVVGAPDKAFQEEKSPEITPDNVACFTPLSDLVQGPSAEAFTPITPTPLGKVEKELLYDLFGELESRAHWLGTVTDRVCQGSPSEPKSKIKNFEAEISADWDSYQSWLTLESDLTGTEVANEQLIYRFEVSDALYFSDYKPAKVLAQEGNKVEVLTLNQDMVSFFIKRRIPTAAGARRQRGEIRRLEISGRTLKLTELYYFNEMLMGSRNWTLNRSMSIFMPAYGTKQPVGFIESSVQMGLIGVMEF